MKPFVVVRLLDHRASFRPDTYAIGEVEFRPERRDTRAERAALEESFKRSGHAGDLKMAMRICTVCLAPTPEAADKIAEERFGEALDSLDFCGGVSGLTLWTLLDAGCWRDLSTGRVTARSQRVTFGPFTAFVIQPERFPLPDVAQALATASVTDLKMRLQRSIHWSRKARWESSRQLRIVFRWFAMESLCKEGDEDIVPQLMWILGYPNGQGALRADQQRIATLKAHPLYRPWKGEIEKRLVQMKEFRHSTAHNGFREQDVSADNLRQFEQLSSLACPRLQGAALTALVHHRKQTRADLLAFLPEHFNSLPNLFNDVTGTVLYSLANPSLEDEE